MNELRNFVTAQHIQSYWNILPSELLDFIHSGLPVYRQTGIVIEAKELLPEKTVFDIKKELALRAARDYEARRCRSVITLAHIPSSFHSTDIKGIIPIAPPKPLATTGAMIDIDAEANRVFKKLKKQKDNQTITDLNTFLFKREEINKYAQLNQLKLIDEARVPPQDSKTTMQPPMSIESCLPQVVDCERFIRSLQISYVSDTEIKIRGGGKNAKTYGMKDLGFQKETSQAWKAFITLLNSKYHCYLVGKARGAKGQRKKSYDIRQKILVEINKKFVSFFNNIYLLRLSEKYKVYELIPKQNEAPGTYRFKFQITNSRNAGVKGFEELSRDELLQQIEELSEKYRLFSKRGDEESETLTYKIKDQLNAAIENACRNDWLTHNRAWSYLSPEADVPFVKYPSKIKGVWKSDSNDSSPVEHPIDDEESSQED